MARHLDTAKPPPVSCSACGQGWERDPALEVKCPTCIARIGTYCSEQRPSGYRIRFGSTLIHPARDQQAMDMGFLHPLRCPAVTFLLVAPATQTKQMRLL